ncbi:MAG: aryl-sulfate sulfotransferase, partial [Chitinophagales bacterium]|nr:aryl-sulfate sulfotransferase [Chitinophagales bacterium]
MRYISIITIVCFLISIKANSQFVYVNPSPNSNFHYPQTTLAIKNGEVIDELSLMNNEFVEITGSLSGIHSYTSRLSDDDKTIVLHPNPIFEWGETVSVTIHSNELRKKSGDYIVGTTYQFQIRDEISTEQAKQYKEATRVFYNNGFGFDPSEKSDLREENIDSLPTFTININNNPSPGEFFFRNRNILKIIETNCFATIIENDGTVTWARDLSQNGMDFKINYNGYLTYFNEVSYYWMVLDSNYSVIDSFQCGNGLGPDTDPHDLSMYPDGHSILFAADMRTMDLTQYGGKPNATVIGVTIQELDVANDVIWEWSGWDHFNITDAVSTVSLTGPTVDYVHPNAVSRDYDGNIILSSRHLSEVTKINRETGEFIWRLNGENNQFTFVDDNITGHFSYQHDARRLDNGNLILFNNGNHLLPIKSSAKEYKIDEVNKIATLVWYYEHPDVNGNTVFGSATGSSQRLANGNTLIDWGTSTNNPDRPMFTEVDSNKNIVWEMKFDEFGQTSYRVHKYLWKPCEMPKANQISVVKITDSTAKVKWAGINNASSYDLQYRKLGNATWKSKNTTNTYKKLKNLSANKSYEFQLRTNCLNGYMSDWTPLDTFTTLPARWTDEEIPMLSFN